MTTYVEQQAILDHYDWRAIGRALAAHFAPDQVEWRVQSKAEPLRRWRLVPYIHASQVADRLDAAVGPGAWSFEVTVIAVEAASCAAHAAGSPSTALRKTESVRLATSSQAKGVPAIASKGLGWLGV